MGADWLPSQGRVFTLKKNTEPTEQQNEVPVHGLKQSHTDVQAKVQEFEGPIADADVQAKIKELKGSMTDEEGLARAYATSSNVSLDSQAQNSISCREHGYRNTWRWVFHF